MAKRTTQTTLKQTPCIELISAIIKTSSSEGEVTTTGASKTYIDKLCMKLPLTPKEALLLSVFVDQAWDNNITYQDLGRHFGVRPVEILRENATLKSLAEKEIIMVRKNDNGITSYRVHPKLVDLLLEEKLPEPKPTTGLTSYDFIDAVFDMLCLNEQGEMENDVLYENIRTLIEGNMHLNICPKLKELNLSNTNLKLLLYMAMLHINNHDFYVGPSDIDDAFSGRDLRRHVNELQEGSHELMNEANGHQKLVEYACKDGMASVNHWRMTDYCMHEIFGEFKMKPRKKTDDREGLMKHEEIVSKELFYPESTARQLNSLQNLLEPSNMKRVMERLAAKGLRKGFTCIFYGAPGTGKTEQVLQLSKRTGRDIMTVDCSTVRDKFVGETEKNIKRVFERYRSLATGNESAPILLFNEADSLFTKRNEGSVASVDKMENALENIILQEMETFEGILIATTNLTGSLDSAFERRFLYKVEFAKPGAEQRKRIWQAQLPELSEEEALTLAQKYEQFAGGQIENIARKFTIETILQEKDHFSMAEIEAACNEEMLNKKKGGAKIGFVC